MNIRIRTEGGVGHGLGGRLAAATAVVGLGAATALHAAWAAGSPFPATDRTSLAELVAGTQSFPSRRDTLLVTALLAGATATVAIGQTPFGDDPSIRRAHAALAGALGLRGVGGLVVSGLGLGSATPTFRRWDLRLYSPICLVLAGAVRRASAGRR